MACSSICYSDKMNRLCRKCDVRGEDSGDPFIECEKIEMKPIQQMVERNEFDELDAMNQYHVHNAWFDVDFGGCPYGIFSAACPVEALHALDNGIILNCVKVLFARIGNSDNLAELDKLAKKLTSLPRQKSVSSGADKDMPRLLWKEGITSMTNISASYRVGIMLTIVVILLQSEGIKYFESVLGSKRMVQNMRECFQMILCY